jgi:hypothetical protein
MAKPLAKLLSMLTHKRRWMQFSLASMFVVVTVLCVWLAAVVNRAHRQRDAVAAIHALGGAVMYDYDFDAAGNQIHNAEPPGPAWLRRLLGVDFRSNATWVYLAGAPTTDADLVHLRNLPELNWLHIGNKPITDAGLVHLALCTKLESLDLGGTEITDLGLDRLTNLHRLKMLDVGGTEITDAGATKLERFEHLAELFVSRSRFTVDGIERIQRALPNLKVHR